MRRFQTVPLLILLLSFLSVPTAQAQIPALSSRPGAAYTVYLDFGGFTFNGIWGPDTPPLLPGPEPAFGTPAEIQDTWARTAEKYSSFDVNVTTIDPAVAAGMAASDAQRQTFYDNTARLMHTVVGGNSNWLGGAAGGVSYVGVTQDAYSGTGETNGVHTNFVFPDNLASAPLYIGEATSHENGHGFGLLHQSDYKVDGVTINEYSSNNRATGSGSYAPVMGSSYFSQRGTCQVGLTADDVTNGVAAIQNDVATIAGNAGMSIIDDGIGHTFASATSLPLLGTSVNAALAKGVITPLLVNGTYDPIGVNNYRKDYFKFTLAASSSVSLSVLDGGDWLTPGVASNGATLRSKLNIYGDTDLTNPLGFGSEAPDTLFETYTGTLAPGTYYAEVTSFGGFQSTFDPSAKYFDMGSFLLTGSGFITNVPEPGTFIFLALGVFGLLWVGRSAWGKVG